MRSFYSCHLIERIWSGSRRSRDRPRDVGHLIIHRISSVPRSFENCVRSLDQINLKTNKISNFFAVPGDWNHRQHIYERLASFPVVYKRYLRFLSIHNPGLYISYRVVVCLGFFDSSRNVCIRSLQESTILPYNFRIRVASEVLKSRAAADDRKVDLSCVTDNE